MISLKHKYALLKNGKIKPLHSDDRQVRWVKKEKGITYLCFDELTEMLGQIAEVIHYTIPIVRTANTEEELKDGTI